MNIKPRLIESNILKKVIKSNKIDKDNNIVFKLLKYTGNELINIVKNYSDYILVILFLFIILYIRYKFNKTIKKKNFIKKEIEVNYIRNQDIINNKIVNTNDNINSESKLDDHIINSIKKEINLVEQDLLLNN